MSTFLTHAHREISAPAEHVYRLLGHYRVELPWILSATTLSDQVVTSGYGVGIVVDSELTVDGRGLCHQRVRGPNWVKRSPRQTSTAA